MIFAINIWQNFLLKVINKQANFGRYITTARINKMYWHWRWSSSGKNLYEIPFLNFCLKCKVEHSSDAMSFNGKIECTERMAMNDREVYRDFRSIGAKFPRRNYVLIGKFNGNTLMM